MPELPASIRLSLWATAALAGRHTLADAVARATPDVAEVDTAPAVARLDLWAQLGERAVLSSLPAPGDLVGLPRGDTAFLGAAVDAGECAWGALIGGALVPEIETVGPAGDEVEILRWRFHEVTPPSHVDTSIADVERLLRTTVAEATAALEDLDVRAWDGTLRDLADRRVAAGRWGLPEGISSRTLRVLTSAATVEVIAHTGLRHLHDAPTLAAGTQRTSVLLGVQRQARRALASAACAAGLELAGV